MIKRINIYLLALMFLLLAGCSTVKHLDDSALLYLGAEIKITGKETQNPMDVKKLVEPVVVPQPNQRFLGLYPVRLWLYNLAGDSVPEKGFRHWLLSRAGEAPVLYNPYTTQRSESNIRAQLKKYGYFDAGLNVDKVIKDQKIKIDYTIYPGQRYVFNSLSFPQEKDDLTRAIAKIKSSTTINRGTFYDLEVLKEERERISNYLTQHGFYAFIPDYLEFKLDSSRMTKTIDVALGLKQVMPSKARNTYTIQAVYVHEMAVDSGKNNDTLTVDGLTFISSSGGIKPEVIKNNVLFKSNQPFDKKQHDITLNKLLSLGVYRFVNIEYVEGTKGDTLTLIPHIYLTRSIPRSVNVKVEATTKSNNFAGPGLSLSYSDNNFMKRAQTFTTSLVASYETQLYAKENLNSYNLKLQNALSIPKLVVPFIDAHALLSKKYKAQTSIKLDNSLLRRGSYFDMYLLDASFGYQWRETATKTHELKLFSINYSNLYRKSEEFKQLLKMNPLIEKSYNEQFIISTQYNYTYNKQGNNQQRIKPYFEGNIEFAGNSLSLVSSIFSPEGSGAEEKILKVPYAQFTRIYADTRFLYQLGKSSLIFRLYGGAGFAYGNSDVLPYSRQFFIGGANSLRGFQYHSVGPGSYYDPENDNYIVDHSGDMKLESNLEFRFPITGYFKGAVFTDAGNIWLLNSLENKAGGLLSFNSFANEIAISSGVGLRMDASFVVLRIDLGLPLRLPYVKNGSQSALKNFNILQWSSYRNNLVLNFAIGYPF